MITIAPRTIILGLAIAWAFGALLGSWGQMWKDGNTALLPQVFAFVAGFILCVIVGGGPGDQRHR